MITSPWKGIPTVAFGGDYNPEQWPRKTWEDDVALMRQAGVNMVSLGMFSWVFMEPQEGVFDFGWLDDLLDLLHAGGISVDLATPTASPPAWFYHAYPQARVRTRDGVPLGPGSRGMASPNAPEYRTAAVRIATELAKRYADHPAVVMWHVHNEYGAPVGADYSDNAAREFRLWLQQRYTDLDGLNRAWGTAFWGQAYSDWSHVNPPGPTPSVGNPSQSLDFARFTDHQLRQCYIAERDAIRAHARQPITTNFMANECPTTDLFAWAEEVDIVSNDHYLTAADPQGHIGLALAADLTRSVGGGKPWIMMEHSTSAVNWQPRNVAKRPGEMARNSLGHLARGADAICFFQWRASRFGAEKFHSAMLPHAGTDSRIWREVRRLGTTLGQLGEIAGSTVRAEAAILWDTESHWAQSLEWRPSVDVDAKERIRAYYERLWRDGITTDFAHPESDLSAYRLVVAPASYLLTDAAAANLTRYVAQGGTLVVSFFSGVVDEHDAVHEGGFGTPLREALGVSVEEFLPMRSGERAALSWPEPDGGVRELPVDTWQEAVITHGAQVLATFASGPAAEPGYFQDRDAGAGTPAAAAPDGDSAPGSAGGAAAGDGRAGTEAASHGMPAITRHSHGSGTGWYVATKLDVEHLAPVLGAAYADAGLSPSTLPEQVEVVRRHGSGSDYVVILNHSHVGATVPFESGAHDLLTDAPLSGPLDLPAGGHAVVRVPVPDSPEVD
ncbi:beta-galactosidase [Pseudactinotalea sp. Z1739]|uniref:beta-galactosidase n=1 Tax=Pseudactinotalea sp. Z1739 TaxID=3413028 RepID=UPI003C7A2FF0